MKELKTYVDVTEKDLRKIYTIALRHAHERIAGKILVDAVMTRAVVAVRRNADIGEVTRLLSEHTISGMPVVDDENRVIGVVSEADVLATAGMKQDHTFTDIVRHLLGEPLPAREEGRTAGDIMSSPPITARAADDIREVARIFDLKRIKRLPVVDDNNRLIGIISRADIVRHLGR